MKSFNEFESKKISQKKLYHSFDFDGSAEMAIINKEDQLLFDFCQQSVITFSNNAIEAILSKFSNKSNFLIELYSDAIIKRNAELSYFLFQVLYLFYKNKLIATKDMKDALKKMQLPEDATLLSNDLLFFNSNEIKITLAARSHELLEEHEVVAISNEQLRQLALDIFSQETKELSDKRIQLLSDIYEIIIKNDPLLYEYQAILSQANTPKAQLMEWIRTKRIHDLIKADITAPIIAADDKTIDLGEGQKVSGFGILKIYLLRLSTYLRNLDRTEIETFKVVYRDRDEQFDTLSLLDTKIFDQFEKKLPMLFESPMPYYMDRCIKEILKPLSLLINAFNMPTDPVREKREFEKYLIYHWEKKIEKLLNACKTKKDVFALIIRCAKKGSDNRKVGGLGNYEDAHPENTFLLQKIMPYFWVHILDESERLDLVENKKFRSGLKIITMNGSVFDAEESRFYSRYIKLWPATKICCLNEAQTDLSAAFDEIQGLDIKKNRHAWGFVPSQPIKLSKPEDLLQKIESFSSVLEALSTDESFKYGYQVKMNNNQYKLYFLRDLILLDDISEMNKLCNAKDTSVTNALLQSLNGEKISHNMMQFLMQRNNQWVPKYKTFLHLMEDSFRRKEEPPAIVVRYFGLEFVRNNKFDEKKYQTMMKHYPVKEDSVFYMNTVKSWYENHSKPNHQPKSSIKSLFSIFSCTDSKQKNREPRKFDSMPPV